MRATGFIRRAVVVLVLAAPLLVGFLSACYTSRPVTVDDIREGNYKQQERLRIIYPSGEVILHDDWTLDFPWALGRVDELTGTPPQEIVDARPDLRRFNLEDAQSVEIYDFNPLKVGALAGGGAAVVVGILMVLMLASLSCPAVYLDLPAGQQMIGALYPAAMFAAPDTTDHLALPLDVTEGPIRITIANEHRESQYIDRIVVGYEAHPAGTTAVTSDLGAIVIGKPLSASRAGRSPEEHRLLATSDGHALQNTGFARTGASFDATSLDRVEAAFDGVTARTFALVIRAEQTLWYQAVLRKMIDDDPRAMMQRASLSTSSLAAWRVDHGIDARVEMNTGDGWTRLGALPSAGIEGFRTHAIVLPRTSASRIDFRISSAAGFWRIDSIALAPVVDASPEFTIHAPQRATTASGADVRSRLTARDGSLVEMHETGERLELEFAAPENESTAFLITTGSYQVHPTPTPLRDQLATLFPR